MSQQLEIKESAHFQIYELGTGLLAPSTHFFLSIYSIYIDSCLNGKSDTENHRAPGQSVSVLVSASSASDPGGGSPRRRSLMGSPRFPSAPSGSVLSLVQPSQSLLVTLLVGIPDLD